MGAPLCARSSAICPMVRSLGTLMESPPSFSQIAYAAGLTGPTSADTLNVTSAGSTPAARSRGSVHSTPSSATSRQRTPSATARSASSTHWASWSRPRARGPEPPGAALTPAPMSHVPRGPTNRHSSMARSSHAFTISVISASVSIQMPLPWLMRWIGTSRRSISSRAAARTSGPSQEGSSVRQLPPSGNRAVDPAGAAARAGMPSRSRRCSPGYRGRLITQLLRSKNDLADVLAALAEQRDRVGVGLERQFVGHQRAEVEQAGGESAYGVRPGRRRRAEDAGHRELTLDDRRGGERLRDHAGDAGQHQPAASPPLPGGRRRRVAGARGLHDDIEVERAEPVRVEVGRRAARLRDRLPAGAGVADDELGGGGGGQQLDRQQAERPRADHTDTFSGHRSGPENGGGGDRRRFEQHGGPQVGA